MQMTASTPAMTAALGMASVLAKLNYSKPTRKQRSRDDTDKALIVTGKQVQASQQHTEVEALTAGKGKENFGVVVNVYVLCYDCVNENSSMAFVLTKIRMVTDEGLVRKWGSGSATNIHSIPFFCERHQSLRNGAIAGCKHMSLQLEKNK
ncbi:hypothetical protein BDN71DRAFT_1433923 [Pleurotus eryngii]|uniref:Uncharacterized protein n=1 Tax=Pleurotus eryngii TaxID=5323 RepID=A0A9P5ZND2_PLEER|nr:hypothetical protein BDN71DRAFT_1433923 [Pleurotus eryngii]